MANALMHDYDITTMDDNREFIFFNPQEFTPETALQQARHIKTKMGYGDEFVYPTDEHINKLWIKNNPQFEANQDSEQAYYYSDSTCDEAYRVIGVELIYKDI